MVGLSNQASGYGFATCLAFPSHKDFVLKLKLFQDLRNKANFGEKLIINFHSIWIIFASVALIISTSCKFQKKSSTLTTNIVL